MHMRLARKLALSAMLRTIASVSKPYLGIENVTVDPIGLAGRLAAPLFGLHAAFGGHAVKVSLLAQYAGAYARWVDD